ncbi:FecR family protein [Mucilaginibacter sp. BJC16-A38]|uniref:FecR family protein n=1 Tax=Mucilaginibacter phenanthrenivorans TaxID=1234842 RepID=UPI002157D127|nr:FecR family protein [Mucilaginibacter phenanthrenivorans]MCR8556720.1 FecR family protein [Mucilaginibacter phenanthrenivorans]
MNKKEFLELLDKYLAGNASNEEEQFLFDVYQRLEDKYEWSTDEMETLDQLEHRLIRRFKNSIQQTANADEFENVKPIRNYFNKDLVIRIAAILLVFLSIGLFWFNKNTTKTKAIFAFNELKNPITHINNTGATEKITFPDNSFVDLKAGSKVVYGRDFSGSLRQVYLEGEGFFQVTKDHTRPFIVYTDKVVAKVLGTSFIVKSGLNNTVAGVIVKTGKVAVFKATEFTKENITSNLNEGVVLLPNHAADLNIVAKQLEKKLSTSPEILKPVKIESFDFDNTPIPAVFSKLQDNYGITIVYDKVKFSSCSLSVNMGKEDFYQKLDLICRTINASYQVRNGDVYVSGAGCGVNQ